MEERNELKVYSFYKITLPSAGKITVNLNSYIQDVYLELTYSSGDKVWDEDIYEGSPTTPKQWSDNVDLQPGTYYIKVYQCSDYTGNYSISAKFNSTGNNAAEPNNGTTQAQSLTLNTQNISGFLSWNDDTDYYKVTLSHAGTIDVHLDSNIYDVYLDLTNENGNKVWDEEDIYYGSSATPKQWSKKVDLEAGTYYVKVYNFDDYTGQYNLNVQYTPAGNNEVEPNNGTAQAQVLTNAQKVSGFLSWNDDTDYYKVILEQSGNLKINLDSNIYDVYLDLVDANGNKVWDEKEVYYGSSATPKQWIDNVDLEAGTYYIRVYQFGENTGTYNLTTQFNPIGNNELEPNNGTT